MVGARPSAGGGLARPPAGAGAASMGGPPLHGAQRREVVSGSWTRLASGAYDREPRSRYLLPRLPVVAGLRLLRSLPGTGDRFSPLLFKVVLAAGL